jgi:PAS domain-containing protein
MAKSPDLYTIGEVAAILGMSTHTIRAWERRHGIGQPQRTVAMQRRYRDEDVELLREVKRAVEVDGMSLRLAFERVRGSQVIEERTTRHRARRSEPLPRSGEDAMWHGVADVLPQLIFLIDSDGRIVESNITGARVFGVVLQQLRGRLFADLVDAFDRAKAVLLYRPRTRTVKEWELNLATQTGPRMYSFQSWSVRRGGATFLALVGAEMFAASATPEAPRQTSMGMASGSGHDVSTASAFQALLDKLPFGVAVATIGPEPRIVYANLRLAATLGLLPRVYTGVRLAELLSGDDVLEALREATTTRTARNLKWVHRSGEDNSHTRRYLDLGFQPLFSSNGRVASVMVMVADTSGDVVYRDQLSKVVADPRFEEAQTVQELAEVALGYLTSVPVSDDVALGFVSPPGSGEGICAAYLPKTRQALQSDARLAQAFQQLLSDDGVRGGRTVVELAADAGNRLVTATPFSLKQKLGVLVWSRPPSDLPTSDQRKVIEAFVARLAVATELLHVRSASERETSRFSAAVSAASVVSDSGELTGLGTRFLTRLARLTDSDGVAIGKIDGSDFVVEAAYARGGLHAKVGERYPLSGQFVSSSLQTQEPTGGRDLGGPQLRSPVREAVGAMRHGLSVPLVFMGRVTHVITLLRKADRPFSQDDARLVQALSGTALLAVSLAPERRHRAGGTSARRRRRALEPFG